MRMNPVHLRELLVSARNADRGWGYYAGKRSRLEPTAWATLALHGHSPAAAASTAAQPTALANWPSRDGLLLERRDGAVNYGFHALALVAVRGCTLEHSAGNATLIDQLQRAKGIALEQSPSMRQDNTLQGWSWTAGTFSWVEPTACSLLALKKWSRQPGITIDPARVQEAEKLLLDRACAAGGWNYGNSRVMEQDLEPHVPTTAWGLLAMQDRRTDPIIQRSLDYLEENAVSERSATALSLTCLALRVFDRPTESVRAALLEQLPVTLSVGNHAAIAMALYALRTDHADAAIRL